MAPASSAAALHPSVLNTLPWAVPFPLHTESWDGWGETDMVTYPGPKRNPSVWGSSPSARQRGCGAWVSLAPRPASGNTKISRGCSMSRCLGHGHQGTCPTQFLSGTSTVITATLGFCTRVKYVHAQALLGESKQDCVPSPPLLIILHRWGLVMLPAGEKFPKWLLMAVAEAARIDSAAIDGHSRQQSRVRDTWSRKIPQQESRDRSCGLINTHCMWRDSTIKQVAGGRC